MALIYQWGFYVLPEREGEFREWLANHEDELADAAPPNYEYLGTFIPLWDTSGASGYLQVWRYGKGRPVDLIRSASSEGADEFTELARQLLSFVDESRAGEETFRLHRSVR